MFYFTHFNYNVTDLKKSMDFYEKALGLKEDSRKTAEDGSYIIVYLKAEEGGFLLELTWLRDWGKDSYNLGDNEFHLALDTKEFDKAKALHSEMGCICFENKKMGIYFINDPDGYWLEIRPAR